MKSILCLSMYVNSLCQFSSVYLSIMDSADEKYLRQLYYNPKHSTAFTSASKLWQYVRLHGRNITKKQLYEWLSKQDVYTSHHPIIHHFVRQKVVTRGLNDVWDVDLMDMSNWAKYNDGVHFVAIFIDIVPRCGINEKQNNQRNINCHQKCFL